MKNLNVEWYELIAVDFNDFLQENSVVKVGQSFSILDAIHKYGRILEYVVCRTGRHIIHPVSKWHLEIQILDSVELEEAPKNWMDL